MWNSTSNKKYFQLAKLLAKCDLTLKERCRLNSGEWIRDEQQFSQTEGQVWIFIMGYLFLELCAFDQKTIFDSISLSTRQKPGNNSFRVLWFCLLWDIYILCENILL